MSPIFHIANAFKKPEAWAALGFSAASLSVMGSGINKDNNNPVRVVNGAAFLASNVPLIKAAFMKDAQISNALRQKSLSIKAGAALLTMLAAGTDNFDWAKNPFKNYAENFRPGEFTTGVQQLLTNGAAFYLFHNWASTMPWLVKSAHKIQAVNGFFIFGMGISSLLDGFHKKDDWMKSTGISMILGGIAFALFRRKV